jgi:hypothetical protein
MQIPQSSGRVKVPRVSALRATASQLSAGNNIEPLFHLKLQDNLL